MRIIDSTVQRYAPFPLCLPIYAYASLTAQWIRMRATKNTRPSVVPAAVLTRSVVVIVAVHPSVRSFDRMNDLYCIVSK